MKKKWKNWIDPVQIFIDRQLAAPWREHQLYKDVVSSKGTSWAWCPVGLPPLYLNETFSITNTIEDELITAIDKKWHGVNARVESAIELLMVGYTLKEVADMLNVHSRTLWVDLKKWSDKNGEDQETVRALASHLSP